MAVYQNTGIRQVANKSRKLGSINVVNGIYNFPYELWLSM
jgi:hypothetical protein